MEKLVHHEGVVVPMDRANVDTDAIIPARFLTSIKRTGFGPFLFDEWRYFDRGVPGQDCTGRPENPQFELNRPPYRAATILLARDNFGCGSSREHAVWAIDEYGIRVMIAPSYGDIFYNNSMKNGLLPIKLAEDQVDQLFKAAAAVEQLKLVVDLPAQTVATADGGLSFHFDIDPFRKDCLIKGLDDVALTLSKSEQIRQFETQHFAQFPWLKAAV